MTTFPYLKGAVAKLLTEFFENDLRRITHALDVLHHAENIAVDRDNIDRDILVAAALLHDAGIKPSEQELGYNNGATQEKFGPPVARRLLEQIRFPGEKINVVCNIVGNHHSPSRFDYPELAILKQADREVNRGETRG